ncbi:hypothetical protein BurJ1DRAFT_3999 [Burkholderiales bacterium JOSHI_001]|nr:hypothetical protein BurJ1DRAFT_3999 [Burkholderiales bacterium JOSHI_001]
MAVSANASTDSSKEGEPAAGRAPGWWLRVQAFFSRKPRSSRASARRNGRRAPAPSTVTDSGFAHTAMADDAHSTLSAPLTDPGQRQLWKDALGALSEVLSRHAASRRVFRHLGVLEKAIAKHGPRAPRQLPIELLEQALAQLETLVNDWSSPGLAYLRSSLSVEVKERLKVREAKEQTLSVFVAPNKLQVDEDSESAFMEFQRHWAAANASAESPATGRPRRAA